RMQLRYGPNRAGPYGSLQPIADLIKLIRKESFFPASAIDLPYIVAPVISMFTALAAFSVIPFGAGWHLWHWHVDGQIANVSIARSVLRVVIMAGSLSLVDIVHKQGTTIPYAAPQVIGLLCFFIAGIAETNRAPFDLPEADTELVAGYHTEYSGMRWGLFQTAEYINMITLSGLAIALFFGGWHGPWNSHELGPLWFFLKLLVFLCVFIWLRASLPRLRYDQLMRFGWKVLLPAATVNAIVTAFFVVLI